MAEHTPEEAWTRKPMTFAAPAVTLDEVKAGTGGKHSTEWHNRRPICPYGCGEEGSLMEIIVKDNKALGIYTHSGSVKPFTAELQMAPKPTTRKLAIGADGEPYYVEDI